MLCYDHSRVVLSLEDPEDTCSDYINANYVDGYKQKNAFISTQGPLPKTYGDFWRMVWEQQCAVVVMTTRCLERGRPKCGQYWPLCEEESAEYGNFQVDNLTTEQQSDYTIAMLHLTNLKVHFLFIYELAPNYSWRFDLPVHYMWLMCVSLDPRNAISSTHAVHFLARLRSASISHGHARVSAENARHAKYTGHRNGRHVDWPPSRTPNCRPLFSWHRSHGYDIFAHCKIVYCQRFHFLINFKLIQTKGLFARSTYVYDV